MKIALILLITLSSIICHGKEGPKVVTFTTSFEGSDTSTVHPVKGRTLSVEVRVDGKKISFADAAKIKNPIIINEVKFIDLPTGRTYYTDTIYTLKNQNDFKEFIRDMKSINGSDFSIYDDYLGRRIRGLIEKHGPTEYVHMDDKDMKAYRHQYRLKERLATAQKELRALKKMPKGKRSLLLLGAGTVAAGLAGAEDDAFANDQDHLVPVEIGQ